MKARQTRRSRPRGEAEGGGRAVARQHLPLRHRCTEPINSWETHAARPLKRIDPSAESIPFNNTASPARIVSLRYVGEPVLFVVRTKCLRRSPSRSLARRRPSPPSLSLPRPSSLFAIPSFPLPAPDPRRTLSGRRRTRKCVKSVLFGPGIDAISEECQSSDLVTDLVVKRPQRPIIDDVTRFFRFLDPLFPSPSLVREPCVPYDSMLSSAHEKIEIRPYIREQRFRGTCHAILNYPPVH